MRAQNKFLACLVCAYLGVVVCSACRETPADKRPAPTTPASSSAAPGPDLVRPFPTGLGGELVFQSDRGGQTELYRLDLAAGRLTPLAPHPAARDEGARWSPDGTQIVFKSDRGSVGTAPQGGRRDLDLWLVRADGTGLRRLTDGPGSDGDPSWMPDGLSILFTSNRDSRGDIYRVWLADGRIERLTRHVAGRAIMPAAAPDGRRAAFAGQTLVRRRFWQYQIYLLDLTSGDAQLLPTAGGACWPAWSPDGRRLLSVGLDEEPSALTLRELATNTRQPFVAHPTLWSYYPDWSPDGQFVAFSVSPAHHEGEDWDVAIAAVDRPHQLIRLTQGAGNDRLPDWRP